MADRRTAKPAVRRLRPARGKTAGATPRERNASGTPRPKRPGTAPRAGASAVVTPIRARPMGGTTPNRSPARAAPPAGDVVLHEHGVTISGSIEAVEDFLDAREIDRRMADPEASRRIPWDQVKATLGL